MTEQTINITFKARYFKLGTLSPATKNVWFVIHGYGQLAKYFLQKFHLLNNGTTVIIAPEGLSHFYVEDLATRMRTGNNRVGATWMTRENRLADIENYCEYLTAVYKAELQHRSDLHITLLGFSQGAATASRWALDSRICFHRLILWAGILPPDMNFEVGKKVITGKRFLVVYGTSDPFITGERLDEMRKLTEKLGVEPEYLTFDGGHDLDEKTLLLLTDPS